MTRSFARPGALLRLALVAAFAAGALTVVGPVANPPSVAAMTSDTVESSILGWINAARTERGLVPLRLHPGLVDLAGDRADSMARTGVFKHPACVGCMFDERGIPYFSGTEVIAWSGYGLSADAARSLFNAWRNSSLHWGILMSARYNYIGLGAADKIGTQGSYAAGLLTESRDRTKPWAQMRGGSRSGTSVAWTWTGSDTRLQTHTSGLKNFDVQYRVDSGSWSTIRTGTTQRSITLTDRAHGHCYSLRVMARDNRDYVSAYTGAVQVCIA